MSILEAILLGLVQGATEYLPVSSSGHLVLVPFLLGFEKPSFAFDVLVQLGTLVGVLVFFRVDLLRIANAVLSTLWNRQPFSHPDARLFWFVVVATIPASVIGLMFKDDFERIFTSPAATFGFLIVTAVLLFVGERFGSRRRNEYSIGLRDSVLIGCAQAFALFPGVSRSGSTISAAMLLGVDRPSAAKFSFVMSIPVMVGAGMIATKDLVEQPDILARDGAAIVVGFLTAAISGYIVIRWFLAYLQTRSLKWFSLYCLLVGVGGLVAVFLRGTPT